MGRLGRRLRQAENKRKQTIQTVWGKVDVLVPERSTENWSTIASLSTRKPTFSISSEPEMWNLWTEIDRQVGPKARAVRSAVSESSGSSPPSKSK